METDEVLDTYRKAALKFIAKVETGRAHSRETYADLKAAVQLHNALEIEQDKDAGKDAGKD